MTIVRQPTSTFAHPVSSSRATDSRPTPARSGCYTGLVADNLYQAIATAPRPALILDATPSDVGFLYGVSVSASGPARELDVADIPACLEFTESVVWLHFNLSNARARSFLTQASFVPQTMRDIFREQENRRRVDWVDGGVLAVISDLIYEVEAEPADVATLWCFAGQRLLLTARTHPLKTTDQLREAIRSGLRVAHALELLAWLLGQRTESLTHVTEDMAEQVGDIEDEILGGRIKEQRVQLGRIRRFCARMRRHFAPDRSSFLKLLQRAPDALHPAHADLVRSEIESLSFLVDEAGELYERAKLLQEELSSRVAEDTGRNLYVLAILSAVFLPMTLITGIFGMNVAGMPGLHSHAAFWVVMLLIVGAGIATLMSIFSRTRH